MFIFLVLPLLATGIRAIQVTKTSPCLNQCGGGWTNVAELNCPDDGYNTTSNGRKMQKCLECESTSTATNSSSTTESDQYWFMFNMKYTLQSCLFENPSSVAINNACSPKCENLRTVLKTTWFKTSSVPAYLYEYCSLDGGAFPLNADTCASCLRNTVSGSQILANFLVTMKNACDNKPDPFQGQTVTLPRALFDASNPDHSSPSPSTTPNPAPLAAAQPVSSNSTSTIPTNPAASQAQVALPTPSSPGSSGLSTGAVAGIGVAAAIGGVSIFAAMLAFCWRRRSRIREERVSSPLQYEYRNDKAEPSYISGSSRQQSVSEIRYEADDGQPRAELPGTQFHGF